MKRIHFLLASSILVLSGCSTYKQAQTPDDVYYSPGAVIEPAVSDEYTPTQSEYYSVPNDNYVRLKASDPAKWSYFDNYSTDYYAGGYPMSPYGYGYGYGAYSGFSMSMGFGMYGYGVSPWVGFGYWSPMSYWNSYYTWMGCYNPYYHGVVVVNPKNTSYNYTVRTSTFNPASYTNNSYNRTNTRVNSSTYVPYSYSQTIRSNYNNTNTNSFRNYNAGQNQRPSVFRNGTNSTQPTRTYSGSSSSFGGSSGGGSRGGGGGGGVSRPGR